jgi:hypothetical protein
MAEQERIDKITGKLYQPQDNQYVANQDLVTGLNSWENSLKRL